MSTKTNNCSMLLLQALIIIMAVIAISHDYDISFSDGFGYGFGLVAYIIFSFLFSCMIYEMSILKEKRWKSKICKTVKGAFKYFNKCLTDPSCVHSASTKTLSNNNF